MNHIAKSALVLLLASAAPVWAADLPATPATLSSVLAHAQPGDRLLLAAGTYSGFSIYHQDFGAGITITSADPANPAIFMPFNIEAGAGLTFSHVDLKVPLPNYNAYNVYGGQHVSFDHVHAYGPPGPPDPDVQVLNFFDSSYVGVTDSEIDHVSHGNSYARSDHITVARNHIHDVNSDTLDFVQVGNVLVTANVLDDFFPTEGNHPDAMQFGTYNSTTPSHDVQITDNLIHRGAGQNSQGIFISDEVGTLPFQNFAITGNTVIGTGSSALRPTHNVGLWVAHNDLVTLAGGDPTTLLVQFSDQIDLNSNSAVSISVTAANGNTNINLGPNTITQPVTDGGAAAVAAFAARVPSAPVPASWLPVPPVQPVCPPDPQVAVLQAQVAALQNQLGASQAQAGALSVKVTSLRATLTTVKTDASAGFNSGAKQKNGFFTKIGAEAAAALALP